MRRFLALATVVAATLAFVTSSASALPPFAVVSDPFYDTATCPGITITQQNEEWGTFKEFSPTKLQIQRHGVATLTANDKTVTSNFSAIISLDPTTTVVKVVGTVYNVQVPGAGNLLLDAGNLVFDFSTNPVTVLHVGGPHQQFAAEFLGDPAPLCDYLAS